MVSVLQTLETVSISFDCYLFLFEEVVKPTLLAAAVFSLESNLGGLGSLFTPAISSFLAVLGFGVPASSATFEIDLLLQVSSSLNDKFVAYTSGEAQHERNKKPALINIGEAALHVHNEAFISS